MYGYNLYNLMMTNRLLLPVFTLPSAKTMKVLWIVFFDAFSVFFGYLSYKTQNLIILKDTIIDYMGNCDKKQ